MEIQEAAFEKYSPVPLLGKNIIECYVPRQKNIIDERVQREGKGLNHTKGKVFYCLLTQR